MFRQVSLLIIGLILCQRLSAQRFKLGVQAGINMSNFGYSESKINSNARFGYQLGLFSHIYLGKFMLIPSTSFVSYRNGIYTINSDEYSGLDEEFFNFQLMFGYRIATVRLLAGPYVNVMNNQYVLKGFDSLFFSLNPLKNQSDYGLSLGVGLNIAKKLSLDLIFQSSLQGTSISLFDKRLSEKLFTSSHKRTLMLTLGYSFF
ncbi:MAG: PorT family protein [Chitinophagales bacterium]|jgi:hypothetical protein|nr:PorT family protein [Chitinophagales bacterium]